MTILYLNPLIVVLNVVTCNASYKDMPSTYHVAMYNLVMDHVAILLIQVIVATSFELRGLLMDSDI